MKPKLLCHCSFVPTRLLNALGFETVRLDQAPVRQRTSSSLDAPQLCGCMQSFARLDLSGIDGVILCNCCASAERLYDRLCRRYPELFVFLLETPSVVTPSSLRWMKAHLEQLLTALHNRFQLVFPTRLEEAASRLKELGAAGTDAWDMDWTPDAANTSGGTIWMLGSGIHPDWLAPLRQIFHGMQLEVSDCFASRRGEALLQAMLHGEGSVEPCPRMPAFSSWLGETLRLHRVQIRGVIGMAAQKCDFGLFALPAIRRACEQADIPVLLMEEEFTGQTVERSRIRYEAFYESLCAPERCAREQRP